MEGRRQANPQFPVYALWKLAMDGLVCSFFLTTTNWGLDGFRGEWGLIAPTWLTKEWRPWAHSCRVHSFEDIFSGGQAPLGFANLARDVCLRDA